MSSLNIWNLAKEKLKDMEEKAEKLNETLEDVGPITSEIKRRHQSHSIVCGSSNSGKTTFIHKYLERTDAVKSTVALEYFFARRTRGKNRDLCNIWELGGGSKLAELLGIPLSESDIQITSLIIFLDLTKPNDLWSTFEKVFAVAKEKIDKIMIQLNKNSPHEFDSLANKARDRFAKYGDDLKVCAPLPIPFMIVGGNYDEFQNMESEKRRNITQTLRFMAHYYGATLMYYSSRMESVTRHGKLVFSHFTMDTSLPRLTVTDHNKAIYIPVGEDSFQAIGAPPMGQNSFARVSQPIQLWREAYCSHFPQKETAETEADPTSDPLFREPVIDKMIEQKQKDLEQYQKQKKDRMAAEKKAIEKISAM